MYLTLIFYLLLLIVCFDKNKKRAIIISALLIGLYLGLRYDYMYDYQSYYTFFNSVSNQSYEQTSHMELGWYYLNRLFQPLGYFTFVFFTSSVFAYGIYVSLKDHAIMKYLPIIILGFVSTSSFSVISSAQRQMLVTGIFLIVFHYFINGRIVSFKDIFSRKTLLYFIVIFLCRYLHSSSIFLLLVPFLYLIPKKSTIVSIVLILLFVGELMAGEWLFPKMISQFVEQDSSYEYLLNVNRNYDSISFLGNLSYIIQTIVVVYVYKRCELTKQQQVCVLLYYISILLFLSINYAFQVFRLGLYINFFTYISIGLFLYTLKSDFLKKLVGLFYIILCIQNSLFIFNVQPGTVEEYKTIFSIIQ